MRKYITVTIVNDSEMQELNKQYRDKDYPTDVLSFDVNEVDDVGNMHIGDLVINEDQAKRQAKDYGNTFEQELAELTEHGMLHLFGVHHEGDDH